MRGIRGPGGALLVERSAELVERLYRERAHPGRAHHLDTVRAAAERVAERGLGPRLASAALLWRVRDDTDVTWAELRAAGVPPRVFGLLTVLGRAESEPYGARLPKVAARPDAAEVLRADLEVRTGNRGEEVPDTAALDDLARLDLLTGRLPAPDLLLVALEGGDEWSRAYAAAGLGLLAEPAAAPPLLRRFRAAAPSGDRWLYTSRRALVRVLAGRPADGGPGDDEPRAPSPEHRPLLEWLLADRVPHVRALALELLGRLRDPGLLPRLTPALRDPDPGVRREAALACGRTGDRSAVEPLLAMLADPASRWSAASAADALGLLGDQRAAAPLAARLVSDQPNLPWSASRALARCPGPEAVAAVLSLLRRLDRLDQAHHAFWALGRLGAGEAGPDLVRALRELMRDPRPGPGLAACVEALGKLREPSAAPLLAELARRAGADTGPCADAHLLRMAEWALDRVTGAR
ncbi:hypothetical protein GCM10027168_17340 [Streptomyces capparidis]